MNKGKKLYEGKAKILYEGPEKGTAIQHFKDDTTAYNNQKKSIVDGKGVLNNRISEHILNNMNVYPKKMLKNLNISNGLIFSQRVMLELTKYGFSREKAYRIVQKNAQNSYKRNISFYQSLMNDSLINKKISNRDLLKMFDLNYHTKRINVIFKRIFK